MQIVGTIMEVGIGVQCPKNGGGTYPGTRITYRDNGDGSLKEQMLHENATKYNPELKAAIASLKKDDVFTMVKEKEGAHWNVKSITNGVVQAARTESSGKTSTSSVSSGSTGSSSPKSTYQTAEERAQTQIYIVRQSTITQALTWFNLANLKPNESPAVEDVIAVAKQFEAHVMGTKFDNGSVNDLESDIL